MSKNKRSLSNPRVLACSALFIALSIVCGKYLKIPVGDILRFSFENLPIILSGIMFGPVCAAIVALLADILGCVLVGYAINPIVTLGAVAIGLISGFISKPANKLPLSLRLALTVFTSHLIGSVLIKTFGLSQWYDISLPVLMLWRLLNYVIVGIVEYLLLYLLLSRYTFIKQMNSIIGE